MNIYIFYDSFFGNTEKVSMIIKNHLSENHQVKILKAGGSVKPDLRDVDLLVIGSPTRAFEPTRPIVSFIRKLEKEELYGLKIALFDTRMDIKAINNRILTFFVRLRGYACTTMVKLLLKKGAEISGEPRGFFVTASEGPLKKGEEESALLWADSLVKP